VRKKSKENLIFLTVCFVLVFSIYGRALGGDFVFDDRGIVDRYNYLQLTNFPRILALPYSTEAAGLYRPTTLFSYALNFSFFGSGPWSFHLFNLILYAWSGYLIFLLLEKIFKRRDLAILTAICFLVLPIHSEAVANITGRSELLALFFSLLTFLELIKEKPNGILVGLWFLLAIGGKETAIAVLPLAALIAYFKEKSGGIVPEKTAFDADLRREGVVAPGILFRVEAGKYNFLVECDWLSVKYFYPALGLMMGALVYFSARFLVLGKEYFLSATTSIVENPLKFASLSERVATASKVLTIYLQKSFLPFGLCSDYSYNQIPVLPTFLNFWAIAGFAFLFVLIFCAIFFWRRQPIISLSSFWFIFSFLPISNLFFPIGTIAGERLMYYPSVGLCVLLAYGLLWISDLQPVKIFRWLALVLIIALVLFYGAMSFRRGGDWLTEKRLFSSAAKCAPNSVLSRSNLGAIYYLEGNLAEAKKELLAAQNIYDGYPKGINNLGLVYWKEDDKEKAREYFLRALDFEFPFYGAYENLALMDLEDGKRDEAKEWLLKLYSGNEKAADLYIETYLESIRKKK
jgi:tetratricopeptide (TPR) repeat protein